MILRPVTLPPQEPFPEHALPELIRRAVWATHYKIQSPFSMVATIAIAVAAEAVQGLIGIQIPHGPYCLPSNWVWIIAKSGDGKTPTMNMLRQPIVDFETIKHAEYREAKERVEVDHRAWELEKVEYEQALRKAARKGMDTSVSKKQLAAHMRLKPKLPGLVKLTHTDATPAALGQGLQSWPNTSLSSDEATMYLHGHMVHAMALFNQLWEPQPLSIERSSWDEPVFVKDPRVMLNWAVQPDAFDRYMARRGEANRELGAHARFLWCRPDSNQGMRNVYPVNVDPQELAGFYDRVTACLHASIGEDGEPLAEKKVQTFSPEAEARHLHFRANIEQALRPGGTLEHVKDYAAKAPRHLARLAGVFEFFETGNTIISLDMLERAATVMNWYIAEYLRIFVPHPSAPQEHLDADRLHPWLHQFAQKRHNRYLIQNDVRKHVLNELRVKERLDKALEVLRQRGWISRCITGKLAFIDMAPHLYHDSTVLGAAIHAYRSSRVKATPAGMP